jgi:Fur family ferric uptake transcriptional regulator
MPGPPTGRQEAGLPRSVETPARRTRMTRQRRVILEVLRAADIHPSADQIHAWVRQQLPHISLATVYRNLEALSARGEIQTLAWAGALKRFDGVVDRHYHIHCPHCDRLADLPLPVSPLMEAQAQAVTDFQITGHRIEFSGICPACRLATVGAHPDPAASEAAGDSPARGRNDPQDGFQRRTP